MHMKKIAVVDYFSQSKKWPPRIPKIKKITKNSLKIMKPYFEKNCLYYLNIVLSNQKIVSNLNKKFKKKYKDTDVLTFNNYIKNKKLGKIFYCDIFFSIDTIEKFIEKNNTDFYNHFNHLLIHSLLHINGYDHQTLNEYNKMRNQEMKILNKMGVELPYEI